MTAYLSRVVTPLWLVLAYAGPALAQDTAHVVVVATTDVHGRVYHWDHVRDEQAPWGLTRAATVVDSLRRVYRGAVVLVDAGDLIQGDPFATYYAREVTAPPHPVIDAMNALRYDAATPGNHEFNWGLDVLARATQTAAFPVVSANIYRMPRDTFAYQPYVVLRRGGVRVGITGFTTPGAMVWDRDNLRGRLEVRRIPPAAERALAVLERAGADLRIALVHSGMDGRSSYDTTGVGAENVAALLAALPVKPHLVVVGHTHRSMRDSVIDGVHFIQPAPRAGSLAVAHVWLVREIGSGAPADASRWRVIDIRGELVPLADVPPDPAVVRRLRSAHERVRTWASEPLGLAEGDWSARYARAQDTPLIDFVNEVQRRAAGAELAATAAFNPAAGLGPGEVRLRDVAGVYPYENTLTAVRIGGTALKAYLEQAAAYFRTFEPQGRVVNDSVPGYDFDIVSGVEYIIDLTYPVDSRIRQLTYRGRLVQPTDTFTLALNNYRQGGGGGFRMLSGLPVVYNRGESIRDLLVDAIRAAGTLRAADYFRPSWQIVPGEAAAAVRRVFAPGERP